MFSRWSTLLMLTAATAMTACPPPVGENDTDGGTERDASTNGPLIDAGTDGGTHGLDAGSDAGERADAGSTTSIQCVGPCATSEWAWVTDNGAENGSVAARGKRYALFEAGQAAVAHGNHGATLNLAAKSALLLITTADGGTEAQVSMTNVDVTPGTLAVSTTGRVAFALSGGPFTTPSTVAGHDLGIVEYQYVVVVLDATANYAWSSKLTGAYNDVSLAFTSDDGLVLGGVKTAGLNGTRGALRRWSADGVDNWQFIFNDSNSTVSGLKVASDDNLFVSGFHSGASDAGIPLSGSTSAFLLKLTDTGALVWGSDLNNATIMPRLALVSDDPVVTINRLNASGGSSTTVARYPGASTTAPSTPTWTLALPDGVWVHALSSDDTRLALLGEIAKPTEFPFGVLGTNTSTASQRAGSLVILDIDANGTLQGGFSINPVPPNNATMAAHNIATDGTRVIVSGTFTNTLNLGFGPVGPVSSGQFVAEFERP